MSWKSKKKKRWNTGKGNARVSKKECVDKEEELPAVSNNRTIVHTALRAALDQREAKLRESKESAQKQQSAAASVLEEFLRQTAEQERLAADGARLGRTVSTGVR